MLPCSKAGFLYAIDVETVNAGIPYADSFCILVHYCIHRISDTQSSIAVYGQIKYKKSVWGLVKTMIEKNCWQGLEDFFTNLGSALVEHSKETISITVKRKSRRRRRPLSIQRPSSEEIEPRGTMTRGSRTGAAARRLSHISTSNIIVFAVLLLLIGLNFVLYYKLQSLEDDAPPYSIIDLHVLKDPPKSHDDWIKLLQKQEALHTVEMQKWQKVLRTAIKLLKQTEESLNELQRSIHPTYTNKIMSIIENHRNFGEQLPRDDDDEDAHHHHDDGNAAHRNEDL
ncbi:PREDICTED: GRAM domain-containing protein 1A-like [Nicrophorus vespilloides]|uniref:GRAM domain-containing protein 1A-like n=1 Tax=Nicrophorus vespilloides TaxID=110193 RepID=A0ABM1M9G1_NICVS|nr:PREDICTED: GRAM domain-containing protein 1A-like [Nicrophorus vespilloides]